MRLVITELPTSVWIQLESETATEMEALERLAAQGEYTDAALKRFRDSVS